MKNKTEKAILASVVFLGVFLTFAENSYSKDDKYLRSIDQQFQKNEDKPSFGRSIKNPIVLPRLKNVEEIQNAYIQKYFPDYRVVISGTQVGMGMNGRSIDDITIKNDEGHAVTLFFEITERVFTRQEMKQINEAVSEIKKNAKRSENKLGSSIDRPISFKNMTDRGEIVKRQNDLISNDYPKYQVEKKEIWFTKNKFIERISLFLDEDRVDMYFDISDYVREYQKTKPVKLVDLIPGIKKLEAVGI